MYVCMCICEVVGTWSLEFFIYQVCEYVISLHWHQNPLTKWLNTLLELVFKSQLSHNHAARATSPAQVRARTNFP